LYYKPWIECKQRGKRPFDKNWPFKTFWRNV
jgi:hypothetical protein